METGGASQCDFVDVHILLDLHFSLVGEETLRKKSILYYI